jgi:hypothetical protein
MAGHDYDTTYDSPLDFVHLTTHDTRFVTTFKRLYNYTYEHSSNDL